MKLQLNVDAPEDGEPQSTQSAQNPQLRDVLPLAALNAVTRVLEEELRALYADADRWDEVEISLSFPSSAEMREINKEYRTIDEPTDILSFPLWEIDGEFLPDGALREILPLGDIVICMEEALRIHGGLSASDVFCLMLAHGFLHLLAWDHDTPEKNDAMLERQNVLKNRLAAALGCGDNR